MVFGNYNLEIQWALYVGFFYFFAFLTMQFRTFIVDKMDVISYKIR